MQTFYNLNSHYKTKATVGQKAKHPPSTRRVRISFCQIAAFTSSKRCPTEVLHILVFSFSCLIIKPLTNQTNHEMLKEGVCLAFWAGVLLLVSGLKTGVQSTLLWCVVHRPVSNIVAVQCVIFSLSAAVTRLALGLKRESSVSVSPVGT